MGGRSLEFPSPVWCILFLVYILSVCHPARGKIEWVVEDDDEHSYLITNLNNRSNDACLKITNDSFIPPEEKNRTLGFNQSCDPVTDRCRRFTNVGYYDESNKRRSCMMATQFLCDPITKRCVCGYEDTVLENDRFQIGNLDGKSRSNGICYIRPTFEYIRGFACAPTTVKFLTLRTMDEDEPVLICGCDSREPESLNTTDPDWWACVKSEATPSPGRMSEMSFIISLILMTRIIIYIIT